jgi:hypothetical protein
MSLFPQVVSDKLLMLDKTKDSLLNHGFEISDLDILNHIKYFPTTRYYRSRQISLRYKPPNSREGFSS